MSQVCVICKASAKCKDSRPTRSGAIYRRFWCVCGHKFSSLEFVINDTRQIRRYGLEDRSLDDILDMAARYTKIKEITDKTI